MLSDAGVSEPAYLEQRRCEQCKEVKNVDRFRKVTNMYTSVHYMSICKDCYSHNQAECKKQAEAVWEAGREEREERRKSEECMQRMILARQREQQEREQQQKEHQQLDAWFAQQPDRACSACKQMLPANSFDYANMSEIDGIWLPKLYQRCIPCHEVYRKGNRQAYPLCPMCNTPTLSYDFLREYQGYGLQFIKVCCENCIPQFEALPEHEQMVWLRSAMVAAYGETAYIYGLQYEEDSHIAQEGSLWEKCKNTFFCHHIGRTKHLARRMSEYRKKWHRTINAHHVLEELPFGPLSMERESRWMFHALKYQWPIDNFERTVGRDNQESSRQQAKLTEAVQSFEPLTAPFETIEPFLHIGNTGTGDAHIVHWFLQQFTL